MLKISSSIYPTYYTVGIPFQPIDIPFWHISDFNRRGNTSCPPNDTGIMIFRVQGEMSTVVQFPFRVLQKIYLTIGRPRKIIIAHKPQRIVEPLIGITFESHLNAHIFCKITPLLTTSGQSSPITSMWEFHTLTETVIHRIGFFYATNLQYTILHFRTTAVIYPSITTHMLASMFDESQRQSITGIPLQKFMCSEKTPSIHRRMGIPNF